MKTKRVQFFLGFFLKIFSHNCSHLYHPCLVFRTISPKPGLHATQTHQSTNPPSTRCAGELAALCVHLRADNANVAPPTAPPCLATSFCQFVILAFWASNENLGRCYRPPHGRVDFEGVEGAEVEKDVRHRRGFHE